MKKKKKKRYNYFLSEKQKRDIVTMSDSVRIDIVADYFHVHIQTVKYYRSIYGANKNISAISKERSIAGKKGADVRWDKK